MKAAVVFDLQQGPVWSDFRDPQPGEHQALVEVRAAAISHVVKGRASGKHYSFDGRLPFVRVLTAPVSYPAESASISPSPSRPGAAWRNGLPSP